MKVSWKVSSASCGPTVATRYPSTSLPCSSSSSWKGGRASFRIRLQNVSHGAFVRLSVMAVDADTRELVAQALREDVGPGDVTAEAVVPEDASGRAVISQKEPGVLFGFEVASEVFRQAGAGDLVGVSAESEWRDQVPAVVAPVDGSARGVLAPERTAPN